MTQDDFRLDAPDAALISSITDIVSTRLAGSLLGLCLYGSAVMRGLRPGSDVDLLAVTDPPLASETRGRLVADIMDATRSDPPLRPVELTSVASGDIRPWGYPPRMDFQYGEWLREEFEQGLLHRSGPRVEPDLAILLTMARRRSSTLVGEEVSALTEPVPVDDFRAALLEVFDPLPVDPVDDRNFVLTLARVWNGLETGDIASKDEAADWALERLESNEGLVLAAERDAYLGLADDSFDADSMGAYTGRVTAEIRRWHTAE